MATKTHEANDWLKEAGRLFFALRSAETTVGHSYWTLLREMDVTLVGIDPWWQPEAANDNRKGTVQ